MKCLQVLFTSKNVLGEDIGELLGILKVFTYTLSLLKKYVYFFILSNKMFNKNW